MDKPLTQKLLIRPENQVLVRNAPDDFDQKLQPLPQNAQLFTTGKGPFDVVLQFVRDKAEIDAYALDCLKLVPEHGVVWMVYPKRSQKIQTDINRDAGWDVLWQAGWSAISIVSIDEAWTALRFRPDSQIKRKPDSIFLK